MRRVRLARIALIPQGAMNSLNPVMRIKRQLIDAHPRARRRGLSDDGTGASGSTNLLASVGLRREVASATRTS